MNDITIILPTGRMQEQCLDILKLLGIKIENENERKYFFYDCDNKINIYMIKPSDIISVMNSGIGDVCFIGNDLLLNQNEVILEKLCDLNFGLCKMVIACCENETINDLESLTNKTIASKYVELVKKYFEALNINLNEIVKMNGSLELAPNIGLADAIVDIKESGRTLNSNNLKDVFTICNINMTLAISRRKKYQLRNNKFKNFIKEMENASTVLYGDYEFEDNECSKNLCLKDNNIDIYHNKM